MEFRARANCKSLPVHYFFMEGQEKVLPIVRKFCQACEVRAECLQFAIDTKSEGIWAGTTTNKRMKSWAKVETLCGTYSGYNRHMRLKEVACEPCREARRKWTNENRRRIRIYGTKAS